MTLQHRGAVPEPSFPLYRRFRPLLVLFMAAANGLVVAAEGPKVGEAAPSLSAKVLLNAPAGASVEWGKLRGKVVVIEFWATWCAPCIASIPHLNELAERFRSDDVVFISLTSESQRTVEPFLKRRPIKGWVALDTADRTGKAYGVDGIPRTFIVGRDGKILGDAEPDSLSPEHIARALQGEPLDLAPPRIGEAPDDDRSTAPRKPAYSGGFAAGRFPAVGSATDPQPDPLVQIVVRPALDPETATSGASAKNRQTWLNVDAVTVVKAAYGRAYQLPFSRVDVRARLPEQKLDVAIWAPPGDIQLFRRLVESGLGSTFRLSAHTEEREADVMLLTVRNAGPLKLAPTASTGGSMMSTDRREGQLVAEVINGTTAHLASTLESRLGIPIIDDTELAGGYDYTLVLPDDLKQVQDSVQALGLRLEPARRRLTCLVVESVGSN
jgi:uncharacterized protein (TIGR03435 family)